LQITFHRKGVVSAIADTLAGATSPPIVYEGGSAGGVFGRRTKTTTATMIAVGTPMQKISPNSTAMIPPGPTFTY
jgi:hypothetical protein